MTKDEYLREKELVALESIADSLACIKNLLERSEAYKDGISLKDISDEENNLEPLDDRTHDTSAKYPGMEVSYL